MRKIALPKKARAILFFLLGSDGVFALLHLFTIGHHPLFNLDTELNLPAAYQALKLAVIGALIAWRSKEYLVKLLGLGAIYVGIDEWFVIHENLETLLRQWFPTLTAQYLDGLYTLGYRSSAWVALALPLLALLPVYGFFLLKKLSATGQRVILASAGFFAAAMIAEVIGSRGSLSADSYFWTVTFEELCEMIGATTLVLLALPLHKHHIACDARVWRKKRFVNYLLKIAVTPLHDLSSHLELHIQA